MEAQGGVMGGGECWPVPLASKLLWVGLSSPICPVWSHLSLWVLKQEEGSGFLHGLQLAPTTIRLSGTVAHNNQSLERRLTQASAQTHLVPSQGRCRQGCKKKKALKKTPNQKAPGPQMSQSGCRMLWSPSTKATKSEKQEISLSHSTRLTKHKAVTVSG